MIGGWAIVATGAMRTAIGWVAVITGVLTLILELPSVPVPQWVERAGAVFTVVWLGWAGRELQRGSS